MVRSILYPLSHKHLNLQLFAHIEPQPTSSRWRALTHSHIRSLSPNIDQLATTEVTDTCLRGVANVLSASGSGSGVAAAMFVPSSKAFDAPEPGPSSVSEPSARSRWVKRRLGEPSSVAAGGVPAVVFPFSAEGGVEGGALAGGQVVDAGLPDRRDLTAAACVGWCGLEGEEEGWRVWCWCARGG